MLQRYSSYFKIFLISLSFIIPFALLYYLDAPSFEQTWKGRTFYMFFIWLFVLELVLDWEKYRAKMANKQSSNKNFFTLDVALTLRTAYAGIALMLPTIYVIISNFYGLNAKITQLARQCNIQYPWASWMPLSIEYLVFTVLFALVILLAYGWSGLKNFSLSLSLLGAIGVMYLIDNLSPHGYFTPFQIFVPATAALAVLFLTWMGYTMTFVGYYSGTPTYYISDAFGHSSLQPIGIGWPCSGVESLLIYTFTILLFLRKTDISWKQKIIYFVIGAIVTYFINVLRIVTIFTIAVYQGNISAFHNYYGPLYSIIWIVSYPIMIIGSRVLWSELKGKLQKFFL